MHIEIQVALNFVISYLYNKLPRRRVNLFGEELEKALKERFQGHWYPEKPFKGSAFRCLKTSEPTDAVLDRAARESGVPIVDILENLPGELAVWVDPGEVSYRIGEKNAVKILYSELNNAMQQHSLANDVDEQHTADDDREVTKTFNPEAPCFRPIDAVGQSFGALSLSPRRPTSSPTPPQPQQPFGGAASPCSNGGTGTGNTNGSSGAAIAIGSYPSAASVVGHSPSGGHSLQNAHLSGGNGGFAQLSPHMHLQQPQQQQQHQLLPHPNQHPHHMSHGGGLHSGHKQQQQAGGSGGHNNNALLNGGGQLANGGGANAAGKGGMGAATSPVAPVAAGGGGGGGGGTPAFLPRSQVPLTFTTATFAQTKFGSTKLKTSSKRANSNMLTALSIPRSRMSPTEFSNYIKQRAVLQHQQHIPHPPHLGSHHVAHHNNNNHHHSNIHHNNNNTNQHSIAAGNGLSSNTLLGANLHHHHHHHHHHHQQQQQQQQQHHQHNHHQQQQHVQHQHHNHHGGLGPVGSVSPSRSISPNPQANGGGAGSSAGQLLSATGGSGGGGCSPDPFYFGNNGGANLANPSTISPMSMYPPFGGSAAAATVRTHPKSGAGLLAGLPVANVTATDDGAASMFGHQKNGGHLLSPLLSGGGLSPGQSVSASVQVTGAVSYASMAASHGLLAAVGSNNNNNNTANNAANNAGNGSEVNGIGSGGDHQSSGAAAAAADSSPSSLSSGSSASSSGDSSPAVNGDGGGGNATVSANGNGKMLDGLNSFYTKTGGSGPYQHLLVAN